MTCYLCTQPISAGDLVNNHHVTYRSQGGTETQPTHQQCHRALHSSRGDFKAWGRQGGLKAAQNLRWAFNLRHVKSHPAYAAHRWEYLKRNDQIGWSAGLVM